MDKDFIALAYLIGVICFVIMDEFFHSATGHSVLSVIPNLMKTIRIKYKAYINKK